MLRDILEIQRYAHTVCKSASVKMDKNFKASFTDTQYPKTYERGNTVYIELPKPTMNTTEEEYVLHRHFVIHEILHHTEGPDVREIWEKNKIPTGNDDPLNNLCMAAEDYRIEHKGAEKYRGDARSINAANGLIVERFIKMLDNMGPEELQQFEEDKYSAGIMAAMLADIEARSTWCPSTLNGNLEVLKNKMPKPVTDNLDKLHKIDYGDKLLNAETEQDAIDIAKEAFTTLYDEDADDHCEQQQQQQSQGQGEGQEQQESGQGQEGQGQAGDGEEGTGRAESKEGEGNKGTPTEGFSDSGKKVKYNKLLLSDHNLQSGSGSGINWQYDKSSLYGEAGFEPTPLDKIRVADFQKDTSLLNHKTSYDLPPDIEDATTRGFANKVRRLIQIKSQARYIGGQTRGKINRKQLYRVGCPTVGNGEWNSKVFKQRYQDDVLDVTIQLLVDSSGSMSGRKYQTATQAAVMLNHAFEQVLHIPVEILTFSESNRARTAIGIIKKAGARLTTEQLIHNFGTFMGKYGGCNSDGEAIQFAAARLRQAPTKRKILIVLSDGSPASSRPGNERAFTEETIKEILKQKEIEIYGIGIRNDSVKHFYPEHQVIHQIEELEPAILRVIKQKLAV